MPIGPFSLVPFEIRILMIVVFAIALFAGWFWVDGLLEAHYTAEVNRMVAEDAARTNASKVKLLERQHAKDQQILAARGVRVQQTTDRMRELENEMERLKGESPEVRDWASAPVPEPVRARHRLR